MLTPDPVVLALTVALSAPVLVSVGPDAPSPRPPAPMQSSCPKGMVKVERFCMDRYEAPNRKGALPLVMYTFEQAEAWCSTRGKRLCYDDEWTRACAGPRNWPYPYGATRQPGRCNDDKVWRRYDGALLRRWPRSASNANIRSLEQLYAQAAGTSSGAESVEHVQELYQGTPGGQKRGCGGHYGVYDLVGNVEEWTRRRDGSGMFQGRLKGRFWGEARTCQSGVSNHGNAFRFYETGFRCCMDPLGD